MSKIKLPFRLLHFVIIILCTQVSLRGNNFDYIGEFSVSEIEERLVTMSEDFDFQLNADVYKYLNQYLVKQRPGAETVLGRSEIYFPFIEEEIANRDVPLEIKYLAVIESSLNPNAVSRVGATGMWQFMKATGRMYGLEIGSNIDERRDPEKSTKAALEYLEDLYERFDDWTLALAAYNCGPGNVSKAMRRSGKSTYWEIRSFLPRETRNYVPKFIAMSYVMQHHELHGLSPRSIKEINTESRKAVIKEAISIFKISEQAGISVAEIRAFNPVLIGRYVPGKENGFVLTLPSLPMYKFLDKMDLEDRILPDLVQDVEFKLEIFEIVFTQREHSFIQKIEKLRIRDVGKPNQVIDLVKQRTLNKFLFEGIAYSDVDAIEPTKSSFRRKSIVVSGRKSFQKFMSIGHNSRD